MNLRTIGDAECARIWNEFKGHQLKRIAVINQKGGSGKTTTSVNLAACLGERGRRVLVIDMDPQASATDWFGLRNAGRGICDIFIKQTPLVELVHPTGAEGVMIVPSSAWLSGAEKALKWDGKSILVFKDSIDQLPKHQWDYIFIDCPPTLGILSANALVGADEVLIPVEAHHMALPGVDRVITSVDTLRSHLNPELYVSKIVPCRVDPRTRHGREVVDELRTRFGALVSDVEIRENVRLAEAPGARQPITIYDPKCNGAEDYRKLAEEIISEEEIA